LFRTLVLDGKRQIQTSVPLTERQVIQSLCITYLTAHQKYWMDSWPIVQDYSKRSTHFQEFILQVWTYGDVLYTEWRENSQSYTFTLQALDVSPTCDVANVKSIIQLFPHLYQS
jgi:hypothetical protein